MMRYMCVLAVACTVVGSSEAAEAPRREKPSARVTMAENFAHYCALSDASTWYCKERRGLVPASQQWDIVGAYCFDQVALARPADPVQLTALLKALDAERTPQAVAVCEEYTGVVAPMALMYNHRLGTWSHTNAGFEARRRKITLDPVSSIPVAQLAEHDRVGIIVTDTNPLLFVANRGDAREEPVDQVKGLEQLLALLGPALGKAATDVALAQVAARADIADLKRLSATTQWQESDRRELSRFTAPPGIAFSDPAMTRLAASALSDREVFLDDLLKVQEWTRAAKAALDPVKGRLEQLVAQRRTLQVAAQQLERGPAQLDRVLDRQLEDPSAWRTHFQTLETESTAVKSLASCASVFDAFVGVVSAKTEEPVTVFSAASRLLQYFNDGGQAPDATVCAELQYDARLLESTTAIQLASQPAVRDPANPTLIKALRDAQANARERHLEVVLVLQRLIAQLEGNRQGIKDVLAKEDDTRKASLSLAIVGSRARDAGVRTIDGKLQLTNRLYVLDESYESPATKSRTTALKVALNSQFTDAVPTERPKDVTTSYRFVRRGLDRLGFGVGMLAYAPAASVSYAAVDPDPGTNQTTTSTTTVTVAPGTTETTSVTRPELKAIREKERLPRSGSYALFLNGRIAGSDAAGFGAQFGVATSTDNPAFLFGLSANITEYVRVGIGRGRFRVKQLAPDQSGPDVRVASADEIRLDTRWEWANYASISINISGLPLFK